MRPSASRSGQDCYCVDCRRASGSGFIPFMGDAVRNRCANSVSLVFGGEIGKTESYTLYAGSLDDPSSFRPTIAIFAEGRPPWALIPPGFKVFDRAPP